MFKHALVPTTLVLALAAAVSVAAALASASPANAATKTLRGTVGPGHTIAMKTSAGKRVRTVKAGVYTILISDRSDEHDFNLSGPGVRKATGVESTGNAVWKRVKLVRGKTYRFWCGPHSDEMKGSFRVR